MRKVIFGSIILLAGCGVTHTPLDDVTHPRHDCALRFDVENQGSQPLTMTALLGPSTTENDCDRVEYANDEKTVAPGSTEHIVLNLQCRSCDMPQHYGVADANKSVLYNESMGKPNVFCSNTVCLGR